MWLLLLQLVVYVYTVDSLLSPRRCSVSMAAGPRGAQPRLPTIPPVAQPQPVRFYDPANPLARSQRAPLVLPELDFDKPLSDLDLNADVSAIRPALKSLGEMFTSPGVDDDDDDDDDADAVADADADVDFEAVFPPPSPQSRARATDTA